MHEEVAAAVIRRDEAVALLVVEPLDRSGRHVCTFLAPARCSTANPNFRHNVSVAGRPIRLSWRECTSRRDAAGRYQRGFDRRGSAVAGRLGASSAQPLLLVQSLPKLVDSVRQRYEPGRLMWSGSIRMTRRVSLGCST